MRIEAVNATLGAIVDAVDVRDIEDKTFAEIEAAWFEYGVLVFRGQKFDDESQIRFSERFGVLERLLTTSIEGARPEIFYVTNIDADGEFDQSGGSRDLFNKGNQLWHTDSSFKRVAAKGSMLRAVVLPASGGQTEFADMRAAYDALDEKRKAWLDDKVAVHSYRYSQGQIGGLDLKSNAELDAIPPVEHQVVKTHPDSRRKLLYLGRHASHLVGEDLEASRALLQDLCAAACQPPRVYTHEWLPGDVVLWDNRCVLHRARPWPADEKRDMRRTTIAGDDPKNEWSMDSAAQ